MFVDISYLERFIKQKLFPNAPHKLVSKLLRNIDRHCKIFLNGRMSYIQSKLLPYYKLLKEVYDIIILNWNTSVANVFKMHFSRDAVITREQLHDFFANEIIANVKIVK